ncbi:MAG: ribonuclease III [Clostridia bacterium]|nr:ribonuclease III [Clostridia bacterium]
MNAQYDAIVLAYIGDGVLELFVRELLISTGETKTGKLSAAAQKLVCAPAQSEKVDALLPLLTEEEAAIYRLGRNHKVSGKPKNASAVEYHRATGMEAVFGYLHLSGKDGRARELFNALYRNI